ncbi:MAG: NYN domain-containing protein [Candidatus Heimdallarchaeota archaeon]
MLSKVGKALRIISDDDKKKIAIVFDGPTIFPKLQLTQLDNLKGALKEIGTVRVGRIITDKQKTIDESDVISAQGFQEEIVGSEVDIHVAIRALEFMNEKNIDIVAVATTDTNLFPILQRIKQEKQLVVISWKENITPALESVADYILYLDYIE